MTLSLGSREAWEGTRELRSMVVDAIRTDNVRRLGDLVFTNREAVLRMPEIHEYLDRLRRREDDRAWDRILGTPGVRGRPRVDNIGLVLRVEKCKAVLGGSAAKAAIELAKVLPLSARTIENTYSRYGSLVRTMQKGYASEAGTMTEDKYGALFHRLG